MRRTLLPLLALSALLGLAAAPPPERGHKGMVAADQRLASQAGATVLAAGGNAADAAVAAALAAGVVQPSASGLGGGGFAVLVLPDGTRAALDFREVAPAAATRDMYKNAPKGASAKGGLAVAVPSEGPGLAALHRRYGRLPLKKVVAPAIALAEGFPVGEHLAHTLHEIGERGTGMAQALFDGPVPSAGDVVRRMRLAATLKAFAKQGAAAMMTGPIAEDMAAAAQAAGGVLTVADLAAVAPKDRTPLVGHYRGWTVVTMPPPSSGGVVMLQALAVLEGYDLTSMGQNSSALLHLYAETFQHAYADRARLMGDPDRVSVPVDAMLAPDRIAAVRAAFDPAHTLAADAYGSPLDPGHDGGTEHISTLDADGFAIALTTTVNTVFGAEVVAPKSGVVLNDQMDDFVARPGEPNAFGLVGSEANAVAPGARPLSSMSPTVLISPDGETRVVVGGSGGPFIISSTVQAIVNLVDFQLDPGEAVSLPRMHHQWQPPLLFLDEGFPADVQTALEARGHKVKVMPFFSAVQVVEGDSSGQTGASDPRKGGWPAGVW